MDVDAVSTSIKSFLTKHKQTAYEISTNQAKALELAVTVGVSEHYRSKGYKTTLVNPSKNGSSFLVKTSTRGHPWNFSKIVLERDSKVYEAHMNLMVRSAHDDGHYCVDLGIVKGGTIPDTQPKTPWKCVENESIVTFAEVKKLVVYPMLLAQFVGIVHEILPTFIGGRLPRGFAKEDHLEPALASLGQFSGNASTIVEAYKKRKIRITVAENYDVRLAKVRGSSEKSPFVYKDDY